MDPPHNLTGVGRLLNQEHPNHPLRLPISAEQYRDPTFITRLSFRHRPRVPTDLADLTARVSLHVDHALFVDTNLTWMPDEWWEELLAQPARVHLTSRVLAELLPFFERHPGHPLQAAVSGNHPGLTFHSDPNDEIDSKCFDYYVFLLLRRRLLLGSAIAHFQATHGREPTAQELTELKMKLQRAFGPRTLALNKKAASPIFTDEALVVQAVIHAIRTGQRTKIFSGDLDVEEQLYTLSRLLTAHYFGQLVAKEYVADFVQFSPRPADFSAIPIFDQYVKRDGATAIDLKGRALHTFIPRNTTFVPVSCSTIGDTYTSELTYGFETTMSGVLDTKARTRGLSTDELTGRNIHPWGIPQEISSSEAPIALVAYDEYLELPATGMRVSQLDMSLTMWPGDPHARVGPPEPRSSSPHVPPVGQRGVMVPKSGPRHAPTLWLPTGAAA